MQNPRDQPQYLTGQMGGYPTDNVKGISELSGTNCYENKIYGNERGSDYEKSYRGGMNGSQLLLEPVYRNPRNILHNNIGENTLLRQAFDKRVFVDSMLRDFQSNPNPFKYRIVFKGYKAKYELIETTAKNEHGEIIRFSYRKYLSGGQDIVFEEGLQNIRYVSINALIMPTFLTYEEREDGFIVPKGVKLAKRYKYLILKIDGLKTDNRISNADRIADDTFIMKLDDDSGANSEYWIPIYDKTSYFESNLQNTNYLDITICDDRGEILQTRLNGKIHDFHKDYKCEHDDYYCENKEDIDCGELNKLKNRLISLKEITICISSELHMIFNVLLPQINKLPDHRI